MVKNDFVKVMSEKSDKELVDIVTILRKDYQEAAVEAAIEELKIRDKWNMHFEHFQNKTDLDNPKAEDVYDPKRIWKIARSGLIIFGIFHFFLEVLFGLKTGQQTGPIVPVFFNYLLSSLWIKSIAKGKKINNPFYYSIVVSFIVLGIRVLLGFLLLLFVNSRISALNINKGWNKDSEKLFVSEISESTNSLGLSDDSKGIFATFMLKNIKSKYPLGIEYVNVDSLINDTSLFQKAVSELNLTFKWVPAFEQGVREKLLSLEGMDSFSETKRSEIVDCIIQNLKATYPGGINIKRIEESSFDEIVQDCLSD